MTVKALKKEQSAALKAVKILRKFIGDREYYRSKCPYWSPGASKGRCLCDAFNRCECHESLDLLVKMLKDQLKD